jgi:hypothetical protein
MGRIDYDRDEAAAAAIDREASVAPEAGSPTMVLKTISEGSYPTDAQKVYACEAVAASADPEEGAAPALPSGGGTIYAANIGANVPAVGTYVLAVRDGGVWVFVY